MHSKIYQAKHELYLSITFASFAIKDEAIKSRLYEFSLIAFRHMKWIGESVLADGGTYNYDRTLPLYKRESSFEILEALLTQLKEYQKMTTDSILSQRVKTDDEYLLHYLSSLLSDKSNDHEITAFNMQRKWLETNLDQEQIDALTLFLFDESYKEYELILVYAYMQTRTENVLEYNVYEDLIAESQFHLKSFGNMMSIMGILALPRELHEMTYIVDDLENFIKNGIDEEEAAKVMCKELSDSIKDEELSKFFDFINYQESYHIELMKKLLKKN